MALVKTGTSGMPVPDKIQFGRQIVIDMTGNANFTTPAPPLASITTAATALETVYNEALTARQLAKSLTSLVDVKAAALDVLLAQEANYVENTSGGDKSKIESSGFSVRNPNAPIGDLPQVVVLDVSPSDIAGTAVMKWIKVKGASSYTIQRTTDPVVESSWVTAGLSTKTKASVNSMTSGTRYYFRVAAMGTAGLGPWSSTESLIAP